MDKQRTKATALVIMGVSGSGKTTVGKALSIHLDWPFYDGDAFHPARNIEKMSKGIPLTDEDRQPWLERLNKLMKEHLDKNTSLIVACSALKKSYREILKKDLETIQFIFLEGSFDLIMKRMEGREGHFMKAEMLQSQFDTLEKPDDAFIISIDQSVEKIVKSVLEKLTG